MTKMDNNTYAILGSFVMGLKEAQDMFSEVGELSVAESSMGPVLQLKDRVHGWRTYFWKNGVTTFCDKVVATYVAEELGFIGGNFEVTAWLIGKASVMVQVVDTNTRPESFVEEQPITDALEMGFNIGMEEDELYLFLKDENTILQVGDEVTGEYKRNFLRGYNPYHWTVVVEKIELNKIVCHCTHVADYHLIR